MSLKLSNHEQILFETNIFLLNINKVRECDEFLIYILYVEGKKLKP